MRSTLAGEALALADGVDSGMFLATLFAELTTGKAKRELLPISCVTDNHSLYDAVKSTKFVAEKRLRLEISNIKVAGAASVSVYLFHFFLHNMLGYTKLNVDTTKNHPALTSYFTNPSIKNAVLLIVSMAELLPFDRSINLASSEVMLSSAKQQNMVGCKCRQCKVRTSLFTTTNPIVLKNSSTNKYAFLKQLMITEQQRKDTNIY